MPIRDETGRVIAIFNPNFDNSGRVIQHRRIEFLRTLAERLATTITYPQLWTTLLEEVTIFQRDLPFFVLYDGADMDDEDLPSEGREHGASVLSTPDMLSVTSVRALRNAADDAYEASQRGPSLRHRSGDNDEPVNILTKYGEVRTLKDSPLFPLEIDLSPNAAENATPGPLYAHIAEACRTHAPITLSGDAMARLWPDLRKTELDDDVRTAVIYPIILQVCILFLMPSFVEAEPELRMKSELWRSLG